MWLKIFLKKKKHESKNWIWIKGLNTFLKCLKELFPLLSNMSHRIVIFFQHNSKNCHFFEKYGSKNWIFLKKKDEKTQRIEPFLNESKNWTLFSFRCDSQNWALFQKKKRNMTLRIEPFWKSMTRRIQPSLWHDSKNSTFLWLKELNFFLKILSSRIELFFFEYDSHNWPFCKYDSHNWTFFEYDSTFFLNMTQRIEPFWNATQRIELFFFECDSQNWAFFTWLTELSLFYVTHRIEPFFKNTTQRLNPFVQYDSENWTLFFFFFFFQKKKKLKELNLFFEHDSKNWFFSKTKFLLSIIMYNVDICGAVYLCRVNTGAIMCPAFFLILDEQRWLCPGRIFKRPAFPECEYLSGVVSSTSAWICKFLSCFHASRPVSICCDVSLLEPVDPVATSTLFAFVHPDCHCITSFIPLSRRMEPLFLKWLKESNLFFWSDLL